MQINGNMKNERDKIDDLFRQKLEGYQVRPSEKVWNNIVSRFNHLHTGPFHLLSIQNIIGALLLAGAGVTAYLIWPSSTERENVTGKGLTTDLTIPSLSLHDQNTSAVYQASPSTTDIQAIQTEYSSAKQGNILQDNPHDNHQRSTPPMTERSDTSEKAPPSGRDLRANEDQLTPNPSTAQVSQSLRRLPPLESPFLSGESHVAPGIFPMTCRNIHQDERIRLRKADYRDPAQFSAGIHFLPEWTNYRTDPGKFESSFTQELLASVHLGNLVLRSGAGISRSQDDGNYQVNYSKYEMTGYYIGMTFEGEGNPVYDSITYSVDEHGLYDTVFYNETYRTDNAYTYLQIPIQVGYSFLNHKRFSFSVVGGPCLSLLLNEKKSDLDFADLTAENIMMEDQTPTRRHSNWQFLTGISARYLVTNKISVSLEPTYRQYFKTVYDSSESGWPPYSFGVRAGISFHF